MNKNKLTSMILTLAVGIQALIPALNTKASDFDVYTNDSKKPTYTAEQLATDKTAQEALIRAVLENKNKVKIVYEDSTLKLDDAVTAIKSDRIVTGDVINAYTNTDIIKTDVPIINLNGEANVNSITGTEYVELGVKATDIKDGDISNSISFIIKNGIGEVVDSIDTSSVNNYTIEYNVKNSNNMSAITVYRTVNIVNNLNLDN